MTTSLGRKGHSADVSMYLLLADISLPIAQMGPDFLLLDKGINHQPTRACIVLRVDNSERRWDVFLPEGIKAGGTRVNITRVRSAPNAK